MSDPQLVLVSAGSEHFHPVDRGRSRALRVYAEHAEPLARGGPAIFHARIAHVARIDAKNPGQAVDRLEGSEILLLDPNIRMLALPRRQISRDLLDDEGFRAGSELGHPARSLSRRRSLR